MLITLVHVRKDHARNHAPGDGSDAHTGTGGGENGEEGSVSPVYSIWFRDTPSHKLFKKAVKRNLLKRSRHYHFDLRVLQH